MKVMMDSVNESIEMDSVNSIDLNYIDFVIIGPEDPLAEGVVDFFNKLNIDCIGPNKFYSQIESSKIFTKRIYEK